MKENELDDLSEKKESEQDSISNSIDNEGLLKIEEGSQNNNEDEEIQKPGLQSIDELLRDDSEIVDYSFDSNSLYMQNSDILLAKYLYISKVVFT